MRTLKLAAFLAFTIFAQAQTTPTMPTFYARRDYQGFFAPAVEVADTNGDRIPDLVVNGSTSTVRQRRWDVLARP